MSYASVEDLRAEGVLEFEATDDRLAALLEEASATIDRFTGWWFAPRPRTFRQDGRDTATLEPPVPPIQIDRLVVDGTEQSISPDDLIVIGAPIQPAFYAPRLTLRHGRFPRGQGNIEVEGLWGYTEDDGSTTGRTPREIRRVCMLLVLRWLPALHGGDAEDARHGWRVTSMRTRDQSVTFARPGPAGPWTGDPEIDRVLRRYRRPMGLGAV